MHQLQLNSKSQSNDESISTRKSIVEVQQSKQRPKSTTILSNTTKSQSLPKTMVVRNSEPVTKSKVTSNGRRTPTSSIGVNGIKNNVDASRKLSSLPATKRQTSINELNESLPIPTILEQPIIISERADSGNGGSDEDINRFEQRNDQHISP